MKNIKRILNLILIMFVILSAFITTKTSAIVTPEMDATGVASHFNKHLTLQQYRSNYDIFCSMHGVLAWNIEDADINFSDGTSINVNSMTSVPTVNVGSDTFFGKKLKRINISENVTLSTKSGDNYTLRQIEYVKVPNKNDIAEDGIATPEEAYILSEMMKNIYNVNLTRELFDYEIDTAAIPIVLSTSPIFNIFTFELEPSPYDKFVENCDFTFTITVDGNDVRIFKYNNKFYIEEPYTTSSVKLLQIKFTTTELDFHDDWSLSSYVQKAWWLVDWVNAQSEPKYKAPSGSNAIKDSQLSDEAQAFESYIKHIAKVSDVSDLTFEEQEYIVNEIDDSGNNVESTGTVKAPVLNYEAGWHDLGKEATVVWDSVTNTYKIGPFAVSYHDEVYPDRDLMFSGISEVNVISNIGPLLKDDGDGKVIDGEYAFLHGNTGKINNEYPESEKEFYIVVGYKDGLEAIENIEFIFKHMNAGAIFDYYEAEGIKEKWEIVSYCVDCKAKNPNSSHSCSSGKKDVYLKRVAAASTGKANIQAMAHGLKAARWYEEKTISTNEKWDTIKEPNKGDLTIVKNVVDKDGNPIQVEEDKIYQFDVTIIRANEDGEYKNTSGGYLNSVTQRVSVTVPKGSSTGRTVLDVEEWWGEAAPFYEVKEVEAGSVIIEGYDYDATELEKSTGQYKVNQINSETELYEGVVVTAKNIYNKDGDGPTPKHGKLRIVKEVIDTNELQEELVFTFEVKIDKNENGNYEVDEISTEKIVVAKGQNTAEWISSEIIWYGTDGPKYEVNERIDLIPQGYVFKSIDSDSTNKNKKDNDGDHIEETIEGKLEEDKLVTVIVKNEKDGILINESGKLKIIKRVVDSEGKPLPVPEDKTFTFKLKLDLNSDGDYNDTNEQKDIRLTVKKGSSFVESGEITVNWNKQDGPPTYEIEETGKAGYTLINISNAKGTLIKDQIIDDIVAINSTGTTGKHGSLKIIKKILDKDGNPTKVKVDTKFKFEVKIDENNNGTYDEDEISDIEIIVPANSDNFTWNSKEFYWTGGTGPKYEVKEIEIPSNYKLTTLRGTPGNLEQNTIKEVIAENKLTNEIHKGKIKIFKVLKDEKGNVFEADEDYTFKFKIDVEGNASREKTISIKKGQSEGYVESDIYEWTGGVAPKYKVTEIDSKGLEATISNGTGVLSEETEYVPVTAINKKGLEEYETEIKLYKRLIGEDGESKAVEEATDFYFRVYITHNDGSEEVENVTVTIPAGESYAEEYVKDSSGDRKVYKWKEGENPPTFRVEEKVRVELDASAGEEFPDEWEWKEIAIENDNNTLIAGETVIGCYNTDDTIEIYEQGQLQIVKKLVYEEKDAEGNIIKDAEENPIETEVTGKEFEFEVKVEDIIKQGENKDDYNTDTTYSETIKIKAGESWTKDFLWKKGKTPKYTVEEIVPAGYEFVLMTHKYQETNYSEETGTKEIPNQTGNPGDGELKPNNTAVVEVKNTFKDGDQPGVYTGNININKTLEIEDKLAETDIAEVDKTFEFKITVKYNNPEKHFTYNGESYNSLTINKEIIGTGSAGPIKIEYYEEGNGPEYIVEEVKCPSKWQLVSAENTSGKLTVDEENVEANFTNKLPGPDRIYVLTMELGGNVWNDTDYLNGKPTDTGHDGKRGELEEGIPNVIVKVYSTKDTSNPKYKLLTDSNGKWQIPEIDMPRDGEKYYVTYVYDGQTYEPTTVLASGTAAEYSDEDLANTAREKYINDSMAIENSGARDNFNNEFAEIWGETSIKDDGTTLGKASGYDLEYISKDIEYNGYTKKSSELITLNEDGTAKYPMEASTKEVEIDESKKGLYYPFNNQTALVSVDKVITRHEDTADIDGDGNITEVLQYTYHAAYPYLNNVNLGLLERPHADIAIEKDLEEAIVVVNGKIYKYKYGEIANTQFAEYPDLLYKQIQINQRNIEYNLNLYKSDYYYRADIYQHDTDLYGALVGTAKKYANLDEMKEDLELDVFLTYKISVTNESDVYDVEVNQISDYVDSSLELVTTDIQKSIDDTTGTEAGEVVVAKKSDWNWNDEGIFSDNTASKNVERNPDGTIASKEQITKKYRRYTTKSLEATKIISGETVSSKVTFRVNKNSDILDSSIGECIQLGAKNNIVEIDNYSTYYKTGETAGRVDEDSAPGNIDIENKNSINWYEDDTDRAPVLRLGLYEQVRNINGLAWEDSDNTSNPIQYDQVIGNGIFDSFETAIENMTTELVEKVTVDGIDYDFIWPTGSKNEDGTYESATFDINGKTVCELTDFDSQIVTSDKSGEEGTYIFKGVPAGNYVVRFTYGDDNTLDVSNKDTNGNIKYSGQDYKSTTYQTNTGSWDNSENIDVNGYVFNEWHNLEENLSQDLSEVRVSDARDDESRRLEVIAKSQNMFYENTSIMDTNNSSYGVDDTDTRVSNDSLKTYYMEANTAKLNMNIESVLNSREAIVDGKTGTDGFFDKDDASKVGGATGVRVHVLNANRKLSNDDSINVKFIKYDVNDIDFGLETRSENNIKLDKQIEQITLKTSAGDILIDAIYDIKYENDNGSLRLRTDSVTGEEIIDPEISLNLASIGTENLQALNRTPGDLGFRYLNVDKDVLQGATITIKYRITALNTGEVDRCNQALISLRDLKNSFTHSSHATLEDLLSDLRSQEANAINGYIYGQYLGQIYYQGASIRTSAIDAVVQTKVKQVIDYVDNDVVFSQMQNVDKDSSWANTSTAELEQNRLIENYDYTTDGTPHIINDGGTRKIVDSNGVAYESEAKNNLIVSVENEDSSVDTLTNPGFIVNLAPNDCDKNDDTNPDKHDYKHSSYINVTVSRYYSSDMDIEEVENIAETLKLYNDVGRRDLETIQGNTKPALGPAEAAFNENDSSATELITLSPPTGTVFTVMLTLQIMAIVLVAITILAGGIYLIKRKVLIK